MLVDGALVGRLERTETATVAALVDALVTVGCREPVPTVEPLGQGLLVVTGQQRYVNRAVGVTLGDLSPADVDTLVRHYAAAGLPAAVQLSSWAPGGTVAALGAAGFVPAWVRSVLAVDPRRAASSDGTTASSPPGTPAGTAAGTAGAAADPPGTAGRVEVVEVGTDAALAAHAADVMVAEPLAAGADRAASDEFMAADRVSTGTTQLLALLDGRPAGCGSLTVVRAAGVTTGWLGAAATVPAARRRGVQTALVRHRLGLAAQAGCDLVGVTASVGSTSARVLRRCGFALVQEQWVVQRG